MCPQFDANVKHALYHSLPTCCLFLARVKGTQSASLEQTRVGCKCFTLSFLHNVTKARKPTCLTSVGECIHKGTHEYFARLSY